MPTDPPTPGEPTSFGEFDRPAAPEARIADTDTAWAAWEDAHRPRDTDFAPTAPVSLPMPLPKGDRRYATTVPSALTKPEPAPVRREAGVQHSTVDQVMAEARRNNRVCPQPLAWQKLYEMLPAKQQLEHGWEPAPPLTGSAWARTPAIAKRMCLRGHVEWAHRQGCLDDVHAYLKALPEDEWHYMG